MSTFAFRSKSNRSTWRYLKTDDESEMLSNALIQISFDGSRFTGWSAANDGGSDEIQSNDKLQKPSKRRRRRGAVGEIPQKVGFVRSVEGVIRDNLAKIYGNVTPNRIVVEGCSRTDRGVHSQGMIAQIYCLKDTVLDDMKSNGYDEKASSIPGKRKPHPISSTDMTYFEPIPMEGNLSRLAFALNRMRPADVQVTGIAPTPATESSLSDLPFHPSLNTKSKTYEYRISIGKFQDPTLRRTAWYISALNELEIEKIKKGCKILIGTHDFAAFQGAPRGAEEKKKRVEQQSESSKRSTICTLFDVQCIMDEPPTKEIYYPGLDVCTYKIVITGDRFLYKMNRFIVGALVALGSGNLDLDDIEMALRIGSWKVPEQEDSRKEFTCAPAHGLTLKEVNYGDLSIDWQPVRY